MLKYVYEYHVHAPNVIFGLLYVIVLSNVTVKVSWTSIKVELWWQVLSCDRLWSCEGWNVEQVQFKRFKLHRSELCAITVGQDVAEMQVFSATVGRLGPSGSKLGQTWSNIGHLCRPGHAEGSVGHVGPMDHVGHWVSEFMENGYWGHWILSIWFWWATSQYNGSLGLLASWDLEPWSHGAYRVFTAILSSFVVGYALNFTFFGFSCYSTCYWLHTCGLNLILGSGWFFEVWRYMRKVWHGMIVQIPLRAICLIPAGFAVKFNLIVTVEWHV